MAEVKTNFGLTVKSDQEIDTGQEFVTIETETGRIRIYWEQWDELKTFVPLVANWGHS